jgi:hypothetical protein
MWSMGSITSAVDLISLFDLDLDDGLKRVDESIQGLFTRSGFSSFPPSFSSLLKHPSHRILCSSVDRF